MYQSHLFYLENILAVLRLQYRQMLRLEKLMTKRPRSTSSKKPPDTSSVKKMPRRASGVTADMSSLKNVKKQTAKARKAK